MSCEIKARSNKGPIVGKPITVATIKLPENNSESSQPAVLTNGLSAIRVGYFNKSFISETPFARAVSTYGLLSSSNKLALTILVSLAVPVSYTHLTLPTTPYV